MTSSRALALGITLGIPLGIGIPTPILALPSQSQSQTDSIALPSATWDFIITSCPDCTGPFVGKTLAQLIIDSPNSVSFASNPSPRQQNESRFYFSIPGYPESASYGYPPTQLHPPEINYSIAWDERGGVLQSIAASFLTEFNEIKNLGLQGGFMGSDGDLDGCQFRLCAVTGYWVDPSWSVSEPPMWSLFALAGLALAMWRSRWSRSQP